MAINLDSVKNRLEKLRQSTEKPERKSMTEDIWKAENGQHQLRLLPYVHNDDNFPFIELKFYYNFGKRSYLAPSTFGNPDPIVEASQKLQGMGTKEDWILGKKLEPKLRVYAPVLIRGQEDKGVKFWGFGVQVYQELLSYMSDPDYGDITDPLKGRDIVIDVQPPKDGKMYSSTTVRIKPNPSKVSEDKNVINAIKNQKNILEIFTEPTYEELATALEKWLYPEQEGELQTDYSATVATDSTTNKKSTADQIGDQWKDLFNEED